MQKVAGTVLLIVLILGIAFLGYCLGKPLLEYFGANNVQTDTPVWTPPETETTEASTEPPVSQETTSATTAVTTPPEIILSENKYAVAIPSSALLNSASLSAFAKKSADNGYTAAMVRLKDENGYIRYASELEILSNAENVTGTLTAEEICRILTENGLSPIAVLAVLSDNQGCIVNPEMSFKVNDGTDMSWLDYTGDTPIRWANPENAATAEYNKAIADELTAAGFRKIMLTHVIFPNLQNYDHAYIAEKYFAADRYKMLMNVIPEGVCVKVDAEDIITGEYALTAEVLKNKSRLAGNKVIVKISRSGIPAESGYPADPAGLLESVMAAAEAVTADVQFSPMIAGMEFSAEETAKMKAKAESLDYKDFYVS